MKKWRLQLQNTKERQKMYEQKKSLMTSFTGQHVNGKGNQAKQQNNMSLVPRLALTLRLIGSSLPVSLYASIAFSHANTGP